MQSITAKVRLMVAVLSLNLIIIIVMDIWLNNSQKLDAKVINTAGKQRMLSQRTVLELHRVLLDEDGAYERLQSARKEFDQNFQLLNATASEYHGFKNDNIENTMMEVNAHWYQLGRLIDRYLQGDHNLYDLETIYNNGDKTLVLMEKAVEQYEQYMMEKRILTHRIQILLAIISFGIILYMARMTLGIQRNFERFLDHSQQISGVKNLDCEGNELEIACAHIEYFLRNVEEAIQSATDTIEKSEPAIMTLVRSTPEADNLLEESEDVMIQVSEELHQTTLRLQKLKNNLQKANEIRSSK